jgi:beta-mannanase
VELGWDASNQPSFPTAELSQGVRYHDGYDTQTILHLTWEPWVDLQDIASGAYDPYLEAYAAAARDWGDTIRLRLAHEMIQDGVYDDCQGQAGCPEWYPWQDQPAAYVAAFRLVHDVFAAAGASNVEFAWCPNNYPFEFDVVKQYYPGPDYVDWLCMDGYNWTNQDGQPGWPSWQWFDDIFFNIYHTFVDRRDFFGDKPVMIGEMASCEAGSHEQPGQTKATWIANTFDRLQSPDYAHVAAFYWFHVDKECDWRINSTAASLSAFQAALSSATFVSHPSATTFLPMALRHR